MKTINLWEIELSKNIIYLNNVNQVIKAIKTGNITGNFLVMDEYNSSYQTKESELEKEIVDNNLHINYFDNKHQVLYSNDFYYTKPIFSTIFFNKYKEIIIKTFTKYLLSNDYYLYINEHIYNEDLLEELIKREKTPIYFFNVNLTEKQIKKLQDNHIEAYVDDIQISTNYLFLDFTREELKEQQSLILDCSDIDKINYKYFKYLPDNCKISFELNENIYELEQYEKLTKFLLKIDKLDKKFQINIDFNKMKLLNKSNLLKQNYVNLNIILTETFGSYTLKEYLEINEKLDDLVKNIKDSNLSPLEKYIAVYNIVKNYKLYNKSNNNDDEDRFLKDILNNNYIVCIGFTKLLECLLDKLDINSFELILDIDNSYEEGFTQEEKPVSKVCHARLLINIDDDKYNVHGFYITDPTWDNDLENDYLNHALMPIDKMRYGENLIWNDDLFLILDVHNFHEFNQNVNIIFKKYFNELNDENKKFDLGYSNIEIILNSYENIVNLLKTVFEIIDYQNWNKIYSKYKFQNEKDYTDFLTDIGHFIIIRTNQSINSQKLIKAHLITKKELFKLKRKEIAEMRNKLSKTFYKRQKEVFPYYSKDNAYLGEKNNIIKK